MARLAVLGFWFHESAPDHWPRPQRLVGRWRKRERAAVIAWLRGGATLVTWPRRSHCRFACGERAMGRTDLTDGTWVWPDGLAHYVEQHAVRLPDRFLAHVLRHRGAVPPCTPPRPRFGLYDAGPWLRWARAQGACLDLAGWAVPDPASRRRIRAELGRGARGTIVLCRRATREVVLAQRDGSLAVHSPRSAVPPRRLAGWDAWPAAPRAT